MVFLQRPSGKLLPGTTHTSSTQVANRVSGMGGLTRANTKEIGSRSIATKRLAKPHIKMLLAFHGAFKWKSDEESEVSEVIAVMEKALEENKHLLGWVPPLDDSDTKTE
ncbi:hypothetical protein H0H81_007355 [Sphagnurus paluster]|uniref:Uncharacterized protein n=1 Tax=Sphagnurus paluster TaxID=117069 RepID=A0A9P7GCA7_9AGAR|nr:hypothetical protein H0H81_007355 [Sphagnurus paluster]